jgi:hypothetical protein
MAGNGALTSPSSLARTGDAIRGRAAADQVVVQYESGYLDAR